MPVLPSGGVGDHVLACTVNACLVFRVSSHHNGPCFYVALQ